MTTRLPFLPVLDPTKVLEGGPAGIRTAAHARRRSSASRSASRARPTRMIRASASRSRCASTAATRRSTLRSCAPAPRAVSASCGARSRHVPRPARATAAPRSSHPAARARGRGADARAASRTTAPRVAHRHAVVRARSPRQRHRARRPDRRHAAHQRPGAHRLPRSDGDPHREIVSVADAIGAAVELDDSGDTFDDRRTTTRCSSRRRDSIASIPLLLPDPDVDDSGAVDAADFAAIQAHDRDPARRPRLRRALRPRRQRAHRRRRPRDREAHSARWSRFPRARAARCGTRCRSDRCARPHTVPPCDSMIFFTVASPMPVPSGRVVKKRSKTRSRTPSGIPGPVSATSRIARRPSRRSDTSQRAAALRRHHAQRVAGELEHRLLDQRGIAVARDRRVGHVDRDARCRSRARAVRASRPPRAPARADRRARSAARGAARSRAASGSAVRDGRLRSARPSSDSASGPSPAWRCASCAAARMPASGLRIPCATEPANSPTAASRARAQQRLLRLAQRVDRLRILERESGLRGEAPHQLALRSRERRTRELGSAGQRAEPIVLGSARAPRSPAPRGAVFVAEAQLRPIERERLARCAAPPGTRRSRRRRCAWRTPCSRPRARAPRRDASGRRRGRCRPARAAAAGRTTPRSRSAARR